MKSYSNKTTCRLLAGVHPGFDRRVQSDNYSTDACKYQEGRTGSFWEADRIAVEHYFLTLRGEGWPVKLAGAVASRLWDAMQANPTADQITFVSLANGNRFALPTDKLDLSSGFNSGGTVRDALTIDVRHLRARIAGLIEADAELVGVGDEA